jgi:mRNA interferase RelE/StbE
VSRHTVTLARSARKELDALRPPLVTRVFAALEALADDPRPPGCKKLRGADALWRVRIGDYRVVYALDDAARHVDVVAIRHRSGAYS